ncbi:MAG: RNA-binding protein [Pedosphaera sp.]|nr:RNA-binding protein [Pedosphaera sp.]
MSTKLHVGNLPFNATAEEVLAFFSTVGPVNSVDLLANRVTGRARGYGFVEMNTADAADKAVDLFDRKEFLGRALKVSLARPAQDQKPRSRFHSV